MMRIRAYRIYINRNSVSSQTILRGNIPIIISTYSKLGIYREYIPTLKGLRPAVGDLRVTGRRPFPVPPTVFPNGNRKSIRGLRKDEMLGLI